MIDVMQELLDAASALITKQSCCEDCDGAGDDPEWDRLYHAVRAASVTTPTPEDRP